MSAHDLGERAGTRGCPPVPVPDPLPAPEGYPWTDPGPTSVMVDGEGIHPLGVVAGRGIAQTRLACRDAAATVDEALAAVGGAPLDRRTLVIAVGSNRSPVVMARKLLRAGPPVPPVFPQLDCEIDGLGVGHFAQISVRGYVAAAPYRSAGARARLVAAWLDDAQLAVVDATEPNYTRVPMDPSVLPVRLATGERALRPWIYASRYGVLGAPEPIALREDQSELFALLAELTGDPRLVGGAADVCAELAVDPAAAEELLRPHAVDDGMGAYERARNPL